MWLTSSSIGRKFIMAVTGAALVLFLTFHASMNIVALFSADAYNSVCEFLGSNWYAVAASVALAVLVFVHFVLAVHLVIWNLQARGPVPYAVRVKPDDVEWSSQNMFSLGTIVILGLGLHLYNFWSKMMFAELTAGPSRAFSESEGCAAQLAGTADADMASNGIYHIVNTFHGIGEHTVMGYVYTLLYLVWLGALWLHLNHGMWSAMQSVGLNNKKWFPRLKMISTAYNTVIILMFAAVAIMFCMGYVPADCKL